MDKYSFPLKVLAEAVKIGESEYEITISTDLYDDRNLKIGEEEEYKTIEKFTINTDSENEDLEKILLDKSGFDYRKAITSRLFEVIDSE